MSKDQWRTVNPSGSKRVVVTKELPGERWLKILADADCRVEICTSTEILDIDTIKAAIGSRCDAAIGQLTESWGEPLFSALAAAGGTAYSNYAVGFNNVDLDAATKNRIPVGNTPGVLTETTAEMAAALTLAAARRVSESERYLRDGRFTGWLPTLFMGDLLRGKTVGVIGAGRIGDAYARMMAEGFKMNVVYYDLYQNESLENYIASYSDFLIGQGLSGLTCHRCETVEELLKVADCVSIHTLLDDTTKHLLNEQRLNLMKRDAIVVNTARGPVIEEAALVAHLQKNPEFRAGLDVFENEPQLAEGLLELENAVIVPHIASATNWTRQGMATLAACNVAGLLNKWPAWNQPNILDFVDGVPPKAAPSILNAEALDIPLFK
jgi:glycerate dehydrogenase